MWDKESYLAQDYVIEFYFSFCPLSICIHTNIGSHATKAQKFSYPPYQTAFQLPVCLNFNVSVPSELPPKSLHGQIFTRVQMHAERTNACTPKSQFKECSRTLISLLSLNRVAHIPTIFIQNDTMQQVQCTDTCSSYSSSPKGEHSPLDLEVIQIRPNMRKSLPARDKFAHNEVK